MGIGIPRRRGTRSPALLALVFGVFVIVIGVTASAQALLVSTHLSTASLVSVVENDAALVRILVNGTITPSDLDPATLSGDRKDALRAKLAAVVSRGGMLRVEVRTPAGELLVASDQQTPAILSAADFSKAADGTSSAGIVATTGRFAGTSEVLAEALPIIAAGHVRAVFVVERDATPILGAIEAARQEIAIVTVTAALVVACILFLIFRSAQRRLTRQTNALLEATRRDPLTGSLNHGALVEELAARLEAARTSSSGIDIALVDVDGFRLLNDTHGHDVGDAALLEVSARISAEASPDWVVGRYGPDEFLVIAPRDDARSLEGAMNGLRTDLAGTSVELYGEEALPLTVSVGMCRYPVDATSVTDLLSVGARTVAAARASGGDAMRVAQALSGESSFTKTFDVLQGLVIAVDTKDRYTKRHSEDVAHYADFLAARLGVDAELRQAVHLAGLLHDVGKIGIPDALLRKPGRLTAEESDAIAQHVALGDMIVRDLPHLELVRAGVRNHHERWDGRGYLAGLAGDDIPLIARIVAVADAFSAMTTTRPYRRALPYEEALRRLDDAAGTQLDERLVRVFVDGLRPTVESPLPDGEGWRAAIWTPDRRVA